MKILVTGGAGFIGSNFVRYVRERHSRDRMIVLDKLTYAGNLRNLDGLLGRHVRFLRGDVCDPRAVARAIQGCDAVVHFAAETHVDRSIVASGAFVKTDVLGTHVMLEAARKEGVSRFVHISTDEVYGEAVGHPCMENDALNPKSPYAASKAGADRLAYSYFATYGLPVVISRCGNNYGPYQYPEKLIPLFVARALDQQPMPLYGDGRNSRDWIHVEDHCAALDLLMRRPGVEGEVYNVSAQDEAQNLWIARRICQWTGRPESLIRRVADRPGHVRRHAVNSAKLRRLGWKPRIRLAEGLRDTVIWYARNRRWWEPTLRSRGFRQHASEVYQKGWRRGR